MESLPEDVMPAPDSDSDSEEKGSLFLEKRALNIKENKAMASTQPVLCFPFFSPCLNSWRLTLIIHILSNESYVNSLRGVFILNT